MEDWRVLIWKRLTEYAARRGEKRDRRTETSQLAEKNFKYVK